MHYCRRHIIYALGHQTFWHRMATKHIPYIYRIISELCGDSPGGMEGIFGGGGVVVVAWITAKTVRGFRVASLQDI